MELPKHLLKSCSLFLVHITYLDTSPQSLNENLSGNPGILGFYTAYLQRTYENFTQPDVAILAHGLLGHTPGLETPEHLLGLRAQIDAILELIHALVSTFGNRIEILLVGHSVGTWLCLQVKTYGLLALQSALAHSSYYTVYERVSEQHLRNIHAFSHFGAPQANSKWPATFREYFRTRS